MKCVERQLLRMVRSVSEDKLYDTIEFNEFLQMMSRQEEEEVNEVSLMEAFKYAFLSIMNFDDFL